jgi:hypothetical protein
MSATQAIRGIAVAAVVVLAVVAAPASASFPGSNGQITFFRDDATDGSVEIWRADANGDNHVTGAQRVAHRVRQRPQLRHRL